MEFYSRLLAINMHVFVSGVLCMAFVLCTYGVECTYFPMRPIFLDSKMNAIYSLHGMKLNQF